MHYFCVVIVMIVSSFVIVFLCVQFCLGSSLNSGIDSVVKGIPGLVFSFICIDSSDIRV